MIINNKIYEKELHKEGKLLILLVFPVLFLIFGVFMSIVENESLLGGFKEIILSPTILLTDFLEVGGIGAAFINSSIIGLFNLYLLKKFKMRINGLLIAAFMTVLGFSFFGKNVFNIVPIYIGGYLYVKYQGISMKDGILVIMFGTALAPLVSEIIFSGIFSGVLSVLIGTAMGILIGFIVIPLSSHMLRFHDGFNLYNIGFTAGIIGTVFTSILRGFDIEINPVNILYGKFNNYIAGFLMFLFIYLIFIGIYLNKDALKKYPKIFSYKGRTITDFTYLTGYGVTFLNMGIMGILSLLYVIFIGGVINGPVMAGIFTVSGFGAFGKHPKNSIPIIIGVIIGAIIMGYDLSSTGIIITVLFSTTIAPIAGTYGVWIGILAGMLHMAIVTNIGVVHGGINLYNNGFSGGLVAGFLVPIIDSFKKGDN